MELISILECDENKHQKHPCDTMEPGLKIIGLDGNCLERIFSFLNEDDILSVAQANSHLTDAANHVLRHQGQKSIHITDDRFPKTLPQINDFRNISATSKRFFFKSSEAHTILPIVGKGITKLIIDFDKITNPESLLHDVEQYCSDSLKTMEWNRMPKTIQTVTKSFPKVEEVTFIKGGMDRDSLQFNKWFPAMKKLQLSNIEFTSSGEPLAVRFPHLENLSIDIDDRYGFSLANFGRMLQLNTQIRCLSITKFKHSGGRDICSALIEFINETLPQLEELSLGKSMNWHFDHDNLSTFKNLRKLDIYLGKRSDIEKPIPLAFEKLESLSIKIEYSIDDRMINFIKKQTDLTSIKVLSEHKLNYNRPNVASIISSLPKVSELYLGGLFLYRGELYDLLEKCKSLTKIQWSYHKKTRRDRDGLMFFDCPDLWQYSIDDKHPSYNHIFTFERRKISFSMN